MNDKKTTIILLAILIILIVLLSLRACNIITVPAGLFEQKQQIEETENVDTEKEELPAENPEETPVVNEIEEIEVPEPVVEEPPKQEEPPAPPKPEAKKEPVNKPAPKVEPKKETSKTELPQPAVRKPKREVVQTPEYKNKSGFKPFQVYSDIGNKENHYIPYGFMGDIRAISIEQGWQYRPHTGKTCIKITYEPSKGRIDWSGIYWTEPANNWGDKGFGFNLTGAERISFWVRGEKGGEIINNFIMGGIQGKQYEDSDSRAIGPIELSTEWQQHIIFLDDADLTNIIGGFCFTITKTNNPQGAVFYLDDIIYE